MILILESSCFTNILFTILIFHFWNNIAKKWKRTKKEKKRKKFKQKEIIQKYLYRTSATVNYKNPSLHWDDKKSERGISGISASPPPKASKSSKNKNNVPPRWWLYADPLSIPIRHCSVYIPLPLSSQATLQDSDDYLPSHSQLHFLHSHQPPWIAHQKVTEETLESVSLARLRRWISIIYACP